MASKNVKVIAKFNALILASTQLEHQCNAFDTLGDIDGISEELLEEMNSEITKIVNSLRNRAELLNAKYTTDLPDIVSASQIAGVSNMSKSIN